MQGSLRLTAVLVGLAAVLGALWLARGAPDAPGSLAPTDARALESAAESVDLAEVEVRRMRDAAAGVEPPTADGAPAIGQAGGPYEVFGRVLDAAGAPIEERARVAVCSRSEWLDSVSVDAGSTYALRLGGAGEYLLRCETSGYALLALPLTLAAEPRRIERDLRLQRPRRLIVRMSVGAGEGLEGFLTSTGFGDPDDLRAIATAAPPSASLLTRAPDYRRDYGVGSFQGGVGYLRAVLGERTVEADMLGVLVLHADPPLYVSIVFGRCVLATLVRPLVVPPGGWLDLGTVTMSPGTEVTGTVVDEQGTAAFAHIVCFPLSTPRAERHLESGRDGSFRVGDLGPERYALLVAAQASAEPELMRAARAAIIDASTPPLARVRLELLPAFEVTFAHLSFDPGVLDLEVYDDAGVPVRSGRVERWSPFETGLPAGDYTWVAQRETGELQRGRFTVGAAATRVEIGDP